MLRNSFILLDRVGEQREQKLWQQGIHTWEDFQQHDTVPGIGDQRKQQLDTTLQKADRNAEKNNHPFFQHQMPDSEHWRLYNHFSDSTAYLDIETTGLNKRRDDITTVAIYDGEGSRVLVRGQELTGPRLQQQLDRHDVIATFNGKQFDIPFLQHHFPGLDLDHIHIDLMYECRKIGLSGGLKSIEQHLGIGRDDVSDIDGRDAIRLWNQYQRGDKKALDKLVEYNKKDVTNLEPLIQHVYRELRNNTAPEHLNIPKP